MDVGKERHRAQALTADGEPLFEGSVGNDPAAVEELLDQVVAAAGEEHTPLVVVDMISGGAVLLLAATERRGIPVAYVTGLRMRRAAQLYDGTAKTDPKDAWVLADYARRNLDRLNVVQATDQQLARMRALNGHDEDLAADQKGIVNRLREALLSTRPGLERVIGNRLASPGILDVLRKYPTIGQLRRAGRARFPQPYSQTVSPPVGQSRPSYLGSGEIPTHGTSRRGSLGPDHPQPRRRPRPNRQQTAQKRHAPSRLRRHPKRPPRPTLPNQTRPRQKPPHRPPPPSPADTAHIILTMLKTQTPNTNPTQLDKQTGTPPNPRNLGGLFRCAWPGRW